MCVTSSCSRGSSMAAHNTRHDSRCVGPRDCDGHPVDRRVVSTASGRWESSRSPTSTVR